MKGAVDQKVSLALLQQAGHATSFCARFERRATVHGTNTGSAHSVCLCDTFPKASEGFVATKWVGPGSIEIAFYGLLSAPFVLLF